MISSILDFVSHPIFLGVAGTVTLIVVVKKIAIPILEKLGEAIRNSALYVNLKSMFCNRCASLHRVHGPENQELNIENKKKSDSGNETLSPVQTRENVTEDVVNRVPTPYSSYINPNLSRNLMVGQ